MSGYDAKQIIQSLKEKQDADRASGKRVDKLSHRQVRQLLKLEKRRMKRKELAETNDFNDAVEDVGLGKDSDGKDYLITEEKWLQNEARIKNQLQIDEKKKMAETRAKEIAIRKGLDPVRNE